MPAPVSVIVPARNAAAHLAGQLEALTRQDPSVVAEIIVVDNGSRDRTRAVAADAAAGDQRIRVLDASAGRGAGYARNVGAAAARGSWLAFCDADDVVTPGWAAALYVCAQATGAELVAGHNDHDALHPDGRRRWPSAIHPQPADEAGRPPAFAEGGNFAISKRAFDAIGGFDESLRFAAEDVDLSWRLEGAGVRLSHCAQAVVHCRDPTELPAALRQAYRYGRGNHGLWRAGGAGVARTRPRPWLAAARVLARAPLAVWSERRRATWARQLAFWLGYLSDAVCSLGSRAQL